MAQNEMRNETAYEHTRIFLQPVAAASILGFFAFACAMFLSGAQYAGWIPGTVDFRFAAPFLIMFGLAQFAASMWAYRARDGLSTAFHGVWGAFWLGFGLSNVISTVGATAAPAQLMVPMLGFWFIALGAVSLACAFASIAANVSLLTTLGVTAAASALMAIGMFTGSAPAITVAGYIFVLAALGGFYTGTAIMIEDMFGRAYLPVGDFRRTREAEDISIGVGEPGVLHGQWRLHHTPRRARASRTDAPEGRKAQAGAGGGE